MEITPAVAPDGQIIDGYGAGMFRISGTVYRGSVIVLPERTLVWHPAAVDGLTPDDLQPVISAEPPCDILLLGCGAEMKLPGEALRAELRRHGISLDPMDTGAACRTLNVLLSEGRRAAAALIAL